MSDVFPGSYSGINGFVDMLRAMQIKEDLDALIGVSGFKGMGKSTFSKQVSKRYIEKYFPGVSYNGKTMEKYTAYTIDDMFKVLDEAPEYAPIDGDEAVNFALGEDWMRRNSKKLKKIFTKVRTKHHIFFFNIPDIWWLDKKYRENMMTIWVHTVAKGKVMVALPNIAPGVEDRWYRKWLQKRYDKKVINFFTPIETVMQGLRKYPCYFDEFSVPKLPDWLYEAHLKIRNKNILEDDEAELEMRRSKSLWQMQSIVPLHNWDKIVELVKSQEGRKPALKEYWKQVMFNPIQGDYPASYNSFQRFNSTFERLLKDKKFKEESRNPVL